MCVHVADLVKLDRSVHKLLWWAHVCLLVTGWQVCFDWRSRRLGYYLVLGRAADRGEVSRASFLGYSCSIRPVEMR